MLVEKRCYYQTLSTESRQLVIAICLHKNSIRNGLVFKCLLDPAANRYILYKKVEMSI